jgi:hypothetical protein
VLNSLAEVQVEAVEDVKMMIRLPGTLRERLRTVAFGERRSMNSQLVVILDRALASMESECPATAATVPGSAHQQ